MKNTHSNSITHSIYRRAVRDALLKLNPLWMARNPVMFVVAIASVLASLAFIKAAVTGDPKTHVLGYIADWLWFTVFFANFAEAIAEGRGKARAPRPLPTDTAARDCPACGVASPPRRSSRVVA